MDAGDILILFLKIIAAFGLILFIVYFLLYYSNNIRIKKIIKKSQDNQIRNLEEQIRYLNLDVNQITIEGTYMNTLQSQILAQLSQETYVDTTITDNIYTAIIDVQKKAYVSQFEAMKVVSMVMAGAESFASAAESFERIYEPLIIFSEKHFNDTVHNKLHVLYQNKSTDFVIELQKSIQNQQEYICNKQAEAQKIMETLQDVETVQELVTPSESPVDESIDVKEVIDTIECEPILDNVSKIDTVNTSAKELSKDEIRSKNRENNDVIEELNFRWILNLFGNGVDIELTSCNVDVTGDWDILDLDKHTFERLIVAFNSKRSDTSLPYAEALAYAKKMLAKKNDNNNVKQTKTA
jgi:hypothetical protein